MRIVADDNIPFIKSILGNYAEVVYIPGHQICRDHLVSTDALLVRTRTLCNENLLKGTAVKFIGTATIGTDHIDLAYCKQNGIHVANAPGCNSNSVTQYIASALAYYSQTKNKPLAGLIMGVIGHGQVGSKVVNLAKALKMEILVNDPPLAQMNPNYGFSPLETLLEKSDILTLHVPLTDFGQYPTTGFFGNTCFRKLKRAQLLINTSRGEVLDELALLNYKSNNFGFEYIVDVLSNEPLVSKVLVEGSLLSTPHIAGYSVDGKANGSAMILKSLFKFFNIPAPEWYPVEISSVNPIHIFIDNTSLSAESTAKKALLTTYNIHHDNDLLKGDLSSFEKIRNTYPTRLEPQHYVVNLKQNCDQTVDMLEMLGFKVLK
jgi:erythronate-4-phosphate dehydrogenase